VRDHSAWSSCSTFSLLAFTSGAKRYTHVRGRAVGGVVALAEGTLVWSITVYAYSI
jgi:hypothetical protein